MCPMWLTFGDLFSVHLATDTLGFPGCQSINKTKASILRLSFQPGSP